MNILSVIFCILAAGTLWLQWAAGYVIVSKDSGVDTGLASSLAKGEFTESDTEVVDRPTAHDNTHVKNLLELYYLVQVVRSYRRPSYLDLLSIASDLFEQLTREEVRNELAIVLSGVDGVEEIFNVGEYPEPDPLKEQLANDFRLLFPLVVKTLGELRDSRADGMANLQEKLARSMNGFRSSLISVMRLESEVLKDIDQRQQADETEVPTNVREKTVEGNKLEEIIYQTDMPVASEKDVVSDYDLEEAPRADEKSLRASSETATEDANASSLGFLPEANEVVYKIGPSAEEGMSQEFDDSLEDDSPGVILLTEDPHLEKAANVPTMAVEAHTPKAVTVKDPEMLALMPVIVEQLREGNVTPEEQRTLAEIFGQLWPLMVTEADRLRSD